MLLARLLPGLLAGAAGVASLAYLAYRQRAQPLSREVALDTVPRQLGFWLPKLPFMGSICLHPPGTADALAISSDGSRARVSYAGSHAARTRAFRAVAAREGLEVLEARGPDGGATLALEVGADAGALAPLLTSLLRALYGLSAAATVVAEVPAASRSR